MKKKIIVNGMSCMHCVGHVKNALMEISGVNSANVDLNSKTALIESDCEIDDKVIKEVIEDTGYDVKKIESI